MSSQPRLDQILADIQSNVQNAHLDVARRSELIAELEQLVGEGTRVAMYYSRRDRSLSHQDTLPFVNMLKSLDAITNLDLVIVSPGGDGTAAETMLELCRRYCPGRLRIVVPLYAKSAATLIALGADEIVMGETSELGPIDAQVFIIQDNADQQVSADHFLRARDDAKRDLTSENPETVEAARIQLSLLSPAFLKNCEDLMEFARDFARKQLIAHMFASEYQEDPEGWDARIKQIVDNLTTSQKRLLHGRMITAEDIEKDCDLKSLKVSNLSSENEYWVRLNELLLRTETMCAANKIGKVLYAKDFEMLGG
jgi:ATP-dependent protease ClpP protease subunit